MRPIDADALKNWIDCGHLRSPTELCFSELDVVQILDMRSTISPLQMAKEIKCYCKEHTECHDCIFCTNSIERICMITGNCDMCPEDWNLPEGGEEHDAPG